MTKELSKVVRGDLPIHADLDSCAYSIGPLPAYVGKASLQYIRRTVAG